jgi:catechol 2,3-dioxygenase-like lactoylglutathione lyase family enzyme
MENKLKRLQSGERLFRTVTRIVVLALWLLPSATAQTRNTASTNKVKSFDHLVINVSDMERALAFYKRLGFTLINEDGWRRGQGQVSIKIGENQKINIHRQDVVGPQNKPEDIGPNDKFNLASIPLAGGADFCLVWGGTIQEAQQHLRDSGVDHISAPRNVTGARGPATSVYFRDPDGNLWEFMIYP